VRAGQPHPPREVADTLTGLIIDGLPVTENEDQVDKLNGPDRPWPRRHNLLLHQDQTGRFLNSSPRMPVRDSHLEIAVDPTESPLLGYGHEILDCHQSQTSRADCLRSREPQSFSRQRRRLVAEAAFTRPSPAWRHRIEPDYRRSEGISVLDATPRPSHQLPPERRLKDAIVI